MERQRDTGIEFEPKKYSDKGGGPKCPAPQLMNYVTLHLVFNLPETHMVF